MAAHHLATFVLQTKLLIEGLIAGVAVQHDLVATGVCSCGHEARHHAAHTKCSGRNTIAKQEPGNEPLHATKIAPSEARADNYVLDVTRLRC